MTSTPAGKETAGTPTDQLREAVEQLVSTIAGRAATSVGSRLAAVTKHLGGNPAAGGAAGLKTAATAAKKLAEGKSPASAVVSTGLSGLRNKVKGAFGGGNSGGNGSIKPKVTNIVESIDVGVPVELAYALWTRFTDFPRYMKKVENVEQVSDEKLRWQAQIFFSHRTWEATIQEQVPDERIIWRSEGEKGHVDGAVTFHELAPNLTRVEVVLEYHPKGLFEHTGNLWRAQGRRVRLELKHFQRQAMTSALLHPEEIEGWQGVIHDGEVVDDGSGRDEEPEDTGEEEEPDERPSRRRTAAASRSRGRSSRTARTGARRGDRT